MIAQFDSAFRSSFRMNIEVVGSQASLFVPNPFKPGRLNVVWLLRGRIPRPLLVSGAPTYQGEVEDMADAILLGKPPLLSLQDSRNNVAAILALLQSAQENRPVQLCPTSSTNVN